MSHLDTFADHQDLAGPEQRIALIDMGSNSFRLIVMQYLPRLSFRLVDEVREVVRLSEGMAEAGIIRAPAMERALRAAHLYAAFCKASGIREVVAIGTSAIRDAHNAPRLLARIKAETGIEVRVLSGAEEAYYGWLAAVNSTTLSEGFVVDIGGGSLQITRTQARRSLESLSLPLGAVRVTESLLPGDPPRGKDVERAARFVQQQLAAAPWYRRRNGDRLVALGGNVRQIARLIQKASAYPLDEIHGFCFTLAELDALCRQLAALPVAGRRRIAGMKTDRADIVLGGALVVRELMRAGGFDTLEVCSQSVREGLFYERFLGTEAPLLDDVRRAAVLNLAHIYRFQETHAQHVAFLTLSLFDQLAGRIDTAGSARELLWAASMLHDIGMAIDYNDHHRHSAYLILSSGLPGFSHRELVFIALLARYHRKGGPQADDLGKVLEAGDQHRLLQLSCLLRLAEFLDRARDGGVRDLHLTFGGDWAQLELRVLGDPQIPLWGAAQHVEFFREAFDLDLQLVAVPYDL